MFSKKYLYICLILIFTISTIGGYLNAGIDKKDPDKSEKPIHEFKIDNEIKRTPVKDQAKSGTCWAFATISFLESEALRLNSKELDLSEMYIVRRTYPKKAISYIRYHGRSVFADGGQAHDVTDQIKDYGIVPESVYTGKRIDENKHNHRELVSVLKGILEGILKQRRGKITPRWMEAFESVLDVYLGEPQGSFEYKGNKYTPRSFADTVLDLNMDDYIEITSYNHHPYYIKFILEVPDNWTYSEYYNLPIDDFEEVMDYALKNGYSFVWDGDVSETTFNRDKKGYAVIPEKDLSEMTRKEREAKITEPEKEQEISQEMRQRTFNNFTSTDDHLMHVVGIAHNQKGTKFYLTKNSWGTDRAHDGYIYMSRSYVRLKTIAILLHKDGLPPSIAEKLGLK